MIGFRDFKPTIHKGGGILSNAKAEPFDSAIEAANSWIEKQGVRVLNVETVILPNLHDEDTTTSALTRREDATYFQIVRVWFELPAGAGAPYR